MNDKVSESSSVEQPVVEDLAARGRREFLVSLGKWSKAVIGGVLLGGVLAPEQAVEARGWDSGGGSGGIWYNSGGGWGGWINGPWGWYDRPRWYNGPHYNGPHWDDRPYWRDRPRWYDGPRWRGQPWSNRPNWHNRPRWDDWHNRRR